MLLSSVGCPHQRSSVIRKIAHRHAHRPIHQIQVLSGGSLFPDDSSLHQADYLEQMETFGDVSKKTNKQKKPWVLAGLGEMFREEESHRNPNHCYTTTPPFKQPVQKILENDF